jgi:hypothetical protein
METIKKTTSFLEVLLFEPESDSITEALGITDERTDELVELLQDIVNDNKKNNHSTITDDIYRMSINVKHVNELSFLLFAYGKYVGSQIASMNSHMDPSKILDILKRFTPPDLSSDDDSDEDI